MMTILRLGRIQVNGEIARNYGVNMSWR